MGGPKLYLFSSHGDILSFMEQKLPIYYINQSGSHLEDGNVVSIEQKEKIKKIEQFAISPGSKLSLVFLILDKRKVSDLSIWSRFGTERETENFIADSKGEMQLLVDSCRSIGLEVSVEQFKEQTKNSFSIGWEILIAKSKNLTEELKRAYKDGDERGIGTLFGYPSTAVAWFCDPNRDIRYKPKEIDETIAQEGLERFLNFRPSPHWREELDEVKNQRGLIKTYAPILFQELLDEEKSQRERH